MATGKAPPSKTYVIEQKVGDFILHPTACDPSGREPRNSNDEIARTVTAETLEVALDEALPRARMFVETSIIKKKKSHDFLLA